MFFFLEVDVLFFCLVTSVGQRKNFLSHQEEWNSDLRISRSDAIPLSHRDSTVSDVYYEVHVRKKNNRVN